MKPINFFPRFNNLSCKSLNVDFHLHSTWSDGKNTISEMINSAQNNLINSIAITDHIRKESVYFDPRTPDAPTKVFFYFLYYTYCFNFRRYSTILKSNLLM